MSRTCDAPECPNVHYALGYCKTHHQRLMRNGANADMSAPVRRYSGLTTRINTQITVGLHERMAKFGRSAYQVGCAVLDAWSPGTGAMLHDEYANSSMPRKELMVRVSPITARILAAEAEKMHISVNILARRIMATAFPAPEDTL